MATDERRDPQDEVLWTSDNPRFGIVRAVVRNGAYAAQLDDLNSDYNEVCLTVFRRDRSNWEALFYIDDAGYPDVDHPTTSGYSDGYAFGVGRSRPSAQIKALLQGEEYTVMADDEGWWLFVQPVEPPPREDSAREPYVKFLGD